MSRASVRVEQQRNMTKIRNKNRTDILRSWDDGNHMYALASKTEKSAVQSSPVHAISPGYEIVWKIKFTLFISEWNKTK